MPLDLDTLCIAASGHRQDDHPHDHSKYDVVVLLPISASAELLDFNTTTIGVSELLIDFTAVVVGTGCVCVARGHWL